VILPNYFILTLLVYLIIKSTLIAVNYNNTRSNLGTAFEGALDYETDY
jgi:hypothetical protein